MRFTHPATWLPEAPDADPDEAERTLARRYLAAYGPSTAAELGRWIGTTGADGKRRLAALGDEVVSVTVDGDDAVLLAADVDAALATEPTGAVRLLPGYDVLTAATPKHAPAVIPDAHRRAVWPGAGILRPVVEVDGRMVGTWRHQRRGSRLTVEVAPFAKPDRALRDGVNAEAARLATYLDGGLDLAWSAP